MRDECFMKNIISRLIRILMCWDGRKMRLLLSRQWITDEAVVLTYTNSRDK